MSVIHYFNPQNDLALANGSPNFTAPKSAVDLAVAGACLPMWYGTDGDRFFGAVQNDWYERVASDFGLNVEPAMRPRPGYGVEPWGWSPAMRRTFENMGVAKNMLPSDAQIEAWRSLSSRVAGASVIAALMDGVPEIVAGRPDLYAPRIVSDVDRALALIDNMGRAMLKLPWSNAGRGQQDTARTTPDELRRRVTGMIARQGSIEISPYYDRIVDFAMLFDGGNFVGYSLFDTDTHGGWTGNRLMSDSEIEDVIAVAFGRQIDMDAIQIRLGHLLEDAASRAGYYGLTGVDFMVARDGQGNTVMPPVEINRRRTMGHVAHILARHIVAPGCTARFVIEPRTGCGHSPAYTVRDGRLTAGTLDLVPPGGAFAFRVSVDGPVVGQ